MWLAPAPGTATPGAPAQGGSAEQALAALSRLRMVPVQAAVLEAALALARAVLAGQTGHPAAQESARALTGILDRALGAAAVRPPTSAPLPKAPTVTGTGSTAQRPVGAVPAGAGDVRRVAGADA